MSEERLDSLRSRLREEALVRGISPRDVDLLLGDVLGAPLTYVVAHGEEIVNASLVEELLQRRFRGEPIQYIRHRTEFFSREYYVDERVLIPRPETEVLVEEALARAPQGGTVLDVGTGSGCIAISIDQTRPDLRVFACDISIAALAVADINRRRLGSRVSLFASDLLSSVVGRFDLIVSNPPYVTASDFEMLAVEVRDHEPRLALTPGPRGTEIIERLMSAAGMLVFEMGFGQEDAVRDIAARSHRRIDAIVPDLAGIPRVVVSSRDA